MKKGNVLVNIFTEWDTLSEIVVASCFNIDEINVDLSFKYFFHENIKDDILKNSISLQKRVVEQRQEDLDSFEVFLKKKNIIVHRPVRLEQVKNFDTPDFSDITSPVINPRDQVLIYGDEIIETSCIWRMRYFENNLMKKIFKGYFDRGAHWLSSPRPEMKDESYDLKFSKSIEEIKSGDFKNYEIMFDGAQCLKFGQDIVMNISNKNHYLGYLWLEKHLKKKVKIHPISITDHHIDGMFMPIRPGVLLINNSSMVDQIHKLPVALQKWKTIKVPLPHSEKTGQNFCLASDNINVNILSLSEKEVVIFNDSGNEDSPLAEVLTRNGFSVNTVRLRHSRLFGGGLHCSTLDMVRDGENEKYF